MAVPAWIVPTPPGCPVAPRFQQIERLGPAHLADRDAIGAQAKRGADKIGERGDAVFRAHRDQIGRGALQLARVLDEDDAVRGLGDLGEQRVGERRLAGRGAAGDEDVAPVGDGLAQRLGLICDHDPGGDIIVEREHRDGGLADREGRRGHDGGQQPLEPLPRLGQLGGNTRGAG